MSDDKRYNGWTNYETWNVNLWMDNDSGSYDYWRERAQDAYDDAEATKNWTREESAKYTIADLLKSHFEMEKDDLLEQSKQTCSMWADLLGGALSEVNWNEIAGNLMEDLDKDAEEAEVSAESDDD